MKLIKQLFIDGGAVVIANFMDKSFNELDRLLDSQYDEEKEDYSKYLLDNS